MQDKFEVGKIVNTFGIKGEVKVALYTEDISNFKKNNKVYVGNKEMLVENARLQKNMLILKLELLMIKILFSFYYREDI